MQAVIVGVILAPGSGAIAEDIDCGKLFESHLETDMSLDYRSFDQTPDQGFRALARAGCPAEAADLIEAYIEANEATQTSLVWHVAQLRGEAGQVEKAIRAASASIDPAETPESAFKWNAHVSAYIAFLQKDQESFETHVRTLEMAAERHRGNRVNAEMWRKLAPFFDLGYSQAVRRAYSEATD